MMADFLAAGRYQKKHKTIKKQIDNTNNTIRFVEMFEKI